MFYYRLLYLLTKKIVTIFKEAEKHFSGLAVVDIRPIKTIALLRDLAEEDFTHLYTELTGVEHCKDESDRIASIVFYHLTMVSYLKQLSLKLKKYLEDNPLLKMAADEKLIKRVDDFSKILSYDNYKKASLENSPIVAIALEEIQKKRLRLRNQFEKLCIESEKEREQRTSHFIRSNHDDLNNAATEAVAKIHEKFWGLSEELEKKVASRDEKEALNEIKKQWHQSEKNAKNFDLHRNLLPDRQAIENYQYAKIGWFYSGSTSFKKYDESNVTLLELKINNTLRLLKADKNSACSKIEYWKTLQIIFKLWQQFHFFCRRFATNEVNGNFSDFYEKIKQKWSIEQEEIKDELETLSDIELEIIKGQREVLVNPFQFIKAIDAFQAQEKRFQGTLNRCITSETKVAVKLFHDHSQKKQSSPISQSSPRQFCRSPHPKQSQSSLSQSSLFASLPSCLNAMNALKKLETALTKAQQGKNDLRIKTLESQIAQRRNQLREDIKQAAREFPSPRA